MLRALAALVGTRQVCDATVVPQRPMEGSGQDISAQAPSRCGSGGQALPGPAALSPTF